MSVSRSSNPTELAQGSDFIESRMRSYAELAQSAAVLGPVIDDVGLDLTEDELAEKVSSEVNLDTVLLSITATDDDPTVAADISTAVIASLREAIDDAEPRDGDGEPTVSIFVARAAQVPGEASSPRPLLNAAVGALVGLAVASGAVVVRWGRSGARNPRPASRREV